MYHPAETPRKRTEEKATLVEQSRRSEWPAAQRLQRWEGREGGREDAVRVGRPWATVDGEFRCSVWRRTD